MALKKSIFAICLLAIAPLVPSSLFAQTVLDFPRVISNATFFTGLAVGNPTTLEVSVTFTAYESDGRLLAGEGIQNPSSRKNAAHLGTSCRQQT